MVIIKVVANDQRQQSQVFKMLKSFGFITDELKTSKLFTIINTVERSVHQLSVNEYYEFHLIDGILVSDVDNLSQIIIDELSNGVSLPTGIYYTGYNMGNIVYEMSIVDSNTLCISDKIELEHDFNDGRIIISNNGSVIPTNYDLAFIGNNAYLFKVSKVVNHLFL